MRQGGKKLLSVSFFISVFIAKLNTLILVFSYPKSKCNKYIGKYICDFLQVLIFLLLISNNNNILNQ